MAYVLNTNDVSKQLYDMNKTYTGEQSWRKLYLQTSLAEQQALSNLQYDYGQAVNEAYASAMQQRTAISNSALGQGYKDALLQDTEAALKEAFNSYRANYESGVQTIESETATANQSITDALTQQAQYTGQMFDSTFDYLQHLFDLYNEGEILNDKGEQVNIFATEENWKKYTTTDEYGNLRLKSKEELLRPTYELRNGADGKQYKDYTGLVDEQGNLTIGGVDFFDQMLNEQAYSGRGLSYGSWLRENNEDLYNWATSYNPYDYNEAGTNFGTFKTMFGMSSTDEQYHFLERFGGWSESKIESKFNEFSDKVNKMVDKSLSSASDLQNPENVANNLNAITNEIYNMAKEFGLQDELDFDSLEKAVAKSYNDALTAGEANISSKTTAGAIMLTSVGAAAGSILPGIGSAIGALVGLIAGVASMAATSHVAKVEQEKYNAQIYENMRTQYLNVVTEMLNYSLNKRQQLALQK